MPEATLRDLKSQLARRTAAVRTSPRIRAVRLLHRASPGLTWAVVGFVAAEAVLPNLTLVAMGHATGRIPAAARDGLGSPAGRGLLVALALAGVCYGVSLLRGPVEDALSAVVRARMTVVLQRRLVSAVCGPAGIAHLEDPETLDRLANAQGQLMGYQPADAPMTLASQFGSWLSGALACAVLSTFRWWLGLVVFLAWVGVRRPLAALISSRIASFRAAGEPLRRSWYLFAMATRPGAAKESRVFGLGPWFAAGHRDSYIEGMAPTWGEIGKLSKRVAIAGTGVFAVYGLGTGVLGWAAYHHEIGLGALTVMLTMLPSSMAVGSITMTDFTLQMMLSALPDLDALTASLTPAAEVRGGGEDPRGMPRREVVFEDVAFRYPGSEHDVVAGLDLVLRAGESTALVGVNGAGKTTLVTLLAGLREATGGRILVDGVPIGDLRVRDWQRQVAVVFQDFTRYPVTVAENVGLGLLDEPADAELLERAAERAGALDFIKALPKGWDTVLSPQYPDGVELSGGQWQRVALARSLYAVSKGAGVLVLDEPTAQLDVRAEAAFYDRFLEITAGATSLVISHRFSTVRRADRIAVLDGGRVTELGSHDELIAAGGTYAEMFEKQAAAFKGAVRR